MARITDHVPSRISGGGYPEIGDRSILVVPNENVHLPRAVSPALQHRFDVLASPGIDNRIRAVMSVVTKRRRDERKGGKCLGIKGRKGLHLFSAVISIVSAPQIQRGHVLRRIRPRPYPWG